MNDPSFSLETLVVDTGSRSTGEALELLRRLGLDPRLVAPEQAASGGPDPTVVVLASADSAELDGAVAQAAVLRRRDHLRLVHVVTEEVLARAEALGPEVCDEILVLGREEAPRVARFWSRCRAERDGRRLAGERLLRERAEQLELASRLAAMGALAAGVGHEINNPLTTVLANLRVVQEVVAEAGGLDEDLRTAIDDAIEGAERIGVIVRDMRALVKQPAVDAAKESDPAEIVRLAIRTATGEARHWARLETHIRPTGMVAIAPARLAQVALNLMTNAVQAFDERDPRTNRIAVTLRQDGGNAVLTVADNGRGVPAELLPRVFEPFFTTRSPGRGVGLGLSIARHVVAAAGGTLELTSGEGQTVATLTLPTSVVTVSRPTVLVIDDDPTVARALQRLLRHACDVDLCSDPRDALRRLSAGDAWDAIVCDLVMPHLSGRALYEEVAQVAPDAARRFVFLTGGAVGRTDAFAGRMLAAGRLMQKPPDREALLRAIASAAAS
ncbi:MAG: response regulator [Alphaproteobacteria bacterium]|nr:response regulator [Alphaproteobacteria bacterium]MCB9697368.1 response regulator [Alphaproteobacteria bacterium]